MGLSRQHEHLHLLQEEEACEDRSSEFSSDAIAPDSPEKKQARMLHDRISKLEPFDRAIVLLWLEDMSYDEIAAIVGISTKAVGVRLVRIKEKLKSLNV